MSVNRFTRVGSRARRRRSSAPDRTAKTSVLATSSVGILTLMNDFLDKAKQFADSHEEQVDGAVDRAGDNINERTDDRYQTAVDKGVQIAQEHTGEEQTRTDSGRE
ncbi:MAG: hypothetical protein QOI74_1075 [Micromonosporaceae bacterium]|nr:hypothetical protein [Micromonosporaceae bacterium]